MEILDLTGAYLVTVAKSGSLEEYEKSFPGLFEHYFRFWAPREKFRVILDESAVAERRQAMLCKLPVIAERFTSKGLDLSGISVVLFVGQDTSNGHVFFQDGKWYVWLPIETYVTETQNDDNSAIQTLEALQKMRLAEKKRLHML